MTMANYIFTVCVKTQPGDQVVLVGGCPELGNWQLASAIKLGTTEKSYPNWSTPEPISFTQRLRNHKPPDQTSKQESQEQKFKANDLRNYGVHANDVTEYDNARANNNSRDIYGDNVIEYKYVIVSSDGNAHWESHQGKTNRFVPIEEGNLHVFDDWFNRIPDCPFAFFDPPLKMDKGRFVIEETAPVMHSSTAQKVVVFGSSVACGGNAWKLQGWAYLLTQALMKSYGYIVYNCSESGSNVSRAIERFNEVVASTQPNYVILSLSLGNEGLYHCQPHQRNLAYSRFISGIAELVTMIKNIGAVPVVTEVYPNGDCILDQHGHFVEKARAYMRQHFDPLICWYDRLDDGYGKWKQGSFFDHAHPNTRGHSIMFEAIDLSIFAPQLKAQADLNRNILMSDSSPTTKVLSTNPRKMEASVAQITMTQSQEALPFAIPENNDTIQESLSAQMISQAQLSPISPTAILIPSDRKVFFQILEGKFSAAAIYEVDTPISISFKNDSDHDISVNPSWRELKAAIAELKLQEGIYISSPHDALSSGILSVFVNTQHTIDDSFVVPPNASITFELASKAIFSPLKTKMLFYDGKIALTVDLKNPHFIRVTNETDTEYDIHPMWNEIKSTFAYLDNGVYDRVMFIPTTCSSSSQQSQQNNVPEFSTILIGNSGLQSRIKVPPRSSVLYKFTQDLQSFHRVALVPLGARCAMRMLLHKLEFDGPCYPFDLTRTSNLSDVNDIVANDFEPMWNKDELYFSPEEGRIFHRRWGGLSFAHEIEEDDDPVNNAHPIYERMAMRYSQRASRFRYVFNNAPEVFLLRTGDASREEVQDLLAKIKWKYGEQVKVKVFLFSHQNNSIFQGLENVVHVNHEMNPDRMNEDPGYCRHCAAVLKNILNEYNVTSRNLFWCPSRIQDSAVKESNGSGSELLAEARSFSSMSELAKLSRNRSSMANVMDEVDFVKQTSAIYGPVVS